MFTRWAFTETESRGGFGCEAGSDVTRCRFLLSVFLSASLPVCLSCLSFLIPLRSSSPLSLTFLFVFVSFFHFSFHFPCVFHISLISFVFTNLSVCLSVSPIPFSILSLISLSYILIVAPSVSFHSDFILAMFLSCSDILAFLSNCYTHTHKQ